MKIAIRKGLGFGLTSGIITTLGLIIGLNSGTHSRNIILGGILVIAIADSLSDALGIHISEESGKDISQKEIWASTFSTLFFKFIFALSFIIPIILFKLNIAIIVSIIWGLFLISIFSFYIAKKRKSNPIKAIFEHIIIAIFVIITTHLVGKLI